MITSTFPPFSGSTTSTPVLGPGKYTTLAGLSKVDVLAELVQDGYWVKATGSRVTKTGWTSKSDWDYVVFDPDYTLNSKLGSSPDWIVGGSGNGSEFNSFEHHHINLILVDKESVWKKYVIATNLIKSLNCETKEERIKVFDSVFGKDKNAQAIDFGDTPF